MSRHPWLRAVQAACSLLVAAGTAASLRAEPPPACIALLLAGERETASGAWEGTDLLAAPDVPVQRFQLGLAPERDLRVELVAEAEGLPAQRLYPAPGQTGALRAGRRYALPGPGNFYLLSGRARLRLLVRPPGAPDGPTPTADPSQLRAQLRDAPPEPVRLTDGALLLARPQRLCTRGAATVEWSLHD